MPCSEVPTRLWAIATRRSTDPDSAPPSQINPAAVPDRLRRHVPRTDSGCTRSSKWTLTRSEADDIATISRPGPPPEVGLNHHSGL